MRSTLHRLASASGCALCLLLAAFQMLSRPVNPAPDGQAQEPTTRFQGGVTEVVVPVVVTDEKGKYISNLVAADFRVLDEGRPQRITSFTHSDKQPLVVGFLVDLSSASVIQWESHKEAVKELIWDFLTDPKSRKGYLITFSAETQVVMNTTSDGDALAAKVEALKPGGGGAALYDALYQACTEHALVKGEPYQPRHVIVVLSDGHNSAGKKSFEEAVEIARRRQVTIYGVSTGAYGFTAPEQGNLERLANATGGRVAHPLNDPYKDVPGHLSTPRDAGNYALEPGSGRYASEKIKGIVKAVESIVGDATMSYVLIYRPAVEPGSDPKALRHIKVELPKLPDAKLRYRDSYYPASPSGQ